ncbi:MAG: molybdopterin molybdotransferase MoeA [Aquabacterium sp.]|uniref:molybdopterin molybdotransferase MoeA n=1 Tax=Aquabacterium sp. TaxID=1872578 RepID=UPI002727FE2F|nr:gephyrin-like molybdotransferase Glp [Aquabacterium sp.]MDO9003618.1 molybdopterin molybdotransferase MoeA [Aquabacterium sp.]
MAVYVPKPLMPLDEALLGLREALQTHAVPSTEVIDSFEALGRVLAEDVVSPVDVPPLDNSAMDGYAVCCADVLTAGVALPQSQRVAAGQVGAELTPGTCARIFTGAPVPHGADAVVMQEQCEAGPDAVRFLTAPAPGQNIRRQGEDIARGATVLSRGLRLSPAALGVAASVGAAQLTVFKQPRVAVLTTGNELVMPGQPLPSGAIYNSNRHMLRGLIQATGARSSDLGLIPDDLASTRAKLRQAALEHDLILTSGGVSVGEEDHLKAAVQAEGELHFWQLAIKPGKPFVFGRIRRPDGSHALYMGLPGNPAASFVTFLLLVRPVLGVLAGELWCWPAPTLLRADFDWPRADKRREFVRVRRNVDGGVSLYPHQGSGVLTSAVWADGLVDLAPGQTVQRGDMVSFVALSEWLAPAAVQCQA